MKSERYICDGCGRDNLRPTDTRTFMLKDGSIDLCPTCIFNLVDERFSESVRVRTKNKLKEKRENEGRPGDDWVRDRRGGWRQLGVYDG